jgi:hypothetical protein
MTPWLHRCPQGHASIEPRQDGTYRCGTCEAKYRVGPFDARETEFPVDDIEPIETPNETDVLAALDAATNSRPSAAARQLSTPVKATTQRLIGLRERGLVETVDVAGKAARWRLTAAGRREVDGQVDPNDGCELATDGGTNEDSMADNDKITPRQRTSAERKYQNRRPEDNPFMEVVDQLASVGVVQQFDVDNPFMEVVDRLRDDDRPFGEIIDDLDEAYDIVGDAAFQEQSFLVPEWEVTVLVDDPNTPSGNRYERHTRTMETAEEAEQAVENYTGWPVDSDQTEMVGYSEVA